MKKTAILFAIAACISFTAIGSTPILKLNLEKGKEYKLKSNSSQTMTMTMNGAQIITEISNINSGRYYVIDIGPDYLLVRVAFDSIISNVSNPYKSSKINTNKPGNPKNPDDLMNNVMLALVKNPLEVKMNFSGKIIEVVNLKAVTDSVMKQLDSLPEAKKTQMKPAVEMTVGQDMLKLMVESPLSYLSGNPISSGDKWESKYTIKPNGMELSITTNYKCKSIADNKAELSGDIAIESPENGVMNMNGAQIPFEMRGMGTTDVSVDLNTGWIMKSKGRQKMQGSMTFNGNAMPMEIESKFEVESVK